MEHLVDSNTAIITVDATEPLLPALQSIESAGFSVVEVLHKDEALLTEALTAFPNLRIGVGNILEVDELEKAQQLGAHFASSLGFMSKLTQTAAVYRFHYIPGIATFSEAMQVASLGCQYAKPFPANKSFCAAINKHLPNLRLFPAEIDSAEAAQDLLQLPSVAAVCLNYTSLEQVDARNYCF